MIRALLVAVIVVCALGVFARPQEASAHRGTYRVNGALGLNLRTGPGGNYARIETMANGTYVKARGHSGNWMYLTSYATGHTGWAWLAYLVPAGGTSTSAPATGGGAICLTNYWGVYVCSSNDVGNAIRYWAAQYGLGWWNLAATAACESDFLPGAYNGLTGVSGIFQFLPSTFYAYGGVSLWDYWDQSRVAAKMFSQGLAYHWHCARLLGIA